MSGYPLIGVTWLTVECSAQCPVRVLGYASGSARMRADLHEAVVRGDAAAVRTLLAAGADPDSRDRYGQTGLMRAARAGDAEVVRVFLDAGAGLDHTAKYHLSALMLAALGGHARVVEMLLAAGASRELRGSGAPGFHEKTALDLAEQHGHADVAALLRAAER